VRLHIYKYIHKDRVKNEHTLLDKMSLPGNIVILYDIEEAKECNHTRRWMFSDGWYTGP